MKTKIASSLCILLLGVLACSTTAFPGPQPTAAPTLLPAAALPTNVPLSQTVTLTSTPFAEESETPLYKITAQIPALTGSNDPRVQAFNGKMNDLVQKEVATFRNDTLQNASIPPIVAGSSFDVQYKLIAQRGDVWSVKFEIMGFADGAAHPYHYSIAVNYDLETGRDITLEEIFLPNSNYLQVISDYCKSQLSTRDIGFNDPIFQTGADPKPENYQRWNLSDDGLVITFGEYQVAPYAAGPQTVTVPYDILGSVMNAQSPLKAFLP